MTKEQVVNYINKAFQNIETYENAMESFKRLDEYLKGNEYTLGSDTIITLLTTNAAFIKATNLIFTKNKKSIIKDEIEFDNMTLFLTIETYCQLNNIEVQKNVHYNQSDEESSIYTNDIMTAYINEIRRYDLLTPEQEVELAKKVAAGDEEAKEKLIKANLRLVISIAKRYTGHGMQLPDLIQEGNLGLMRAIERFDVEKGYKLSTYASWWILQGITRSIADKSRNIRIPVHLFEKVRKFNKNQLELTKELGREPTIEEVARKMNITPERAAEFYKLTVDTVSLDAPINEEDDDALLGRFIGNENQDTVEENLESIDLKERISEMLLSLTEREREVLTLRFGLDGGDDRTLEEVGYMYGVTRERIRQIEAKALRKLRQPSNSKRVVDYYDKEVQFPRKIKVRHNFEREIDNKIEI